MRGSRRKLSWTRHVALRIGVTTALVSALLLAVGGPPAAAASASAYSLPMSPLSGAVLMAQAIRAGRIAVLGHSAGFYNSGTAVTIRPDTMASGLGSSPVNSTPVAASPNVAGLLISGGNDYNCPEIQGFYVSTDNGATWPHRACMAAVSGYFGQGDPGVAWDRLGNAYGTGLKGTSLGPVGIFSTKSTDKGVTWSAPVLAQTTVFASGTIDISRLEVDVNATSPHVNCLYVSGTQFDGSSDSQIYVSHSCNGGATWSSPAAASPFCTFPSCVNTFSTIAIDKSGRVYVTWMTCTPNGPTGDCGGTIANLYVTKSIDGGITWSAPSLIGSDNLAPDTCGAFYGCLPNTRERVSELPQVDVARSGSHVGRVYVIDYNWTGISMQVHVRHSDNGVSWSAPVAVSGLGTHDQFFPWLATDHRICSQGCGEVGVIWLDRRNDPSNISYQAFAAVSSDGVTFSAPQLISSGGLESPMNDGFGGGFMGDYTGGYWNSKKVGTRTVSYYHAAWSDTRNGVSSQDWAGGVTG